MKRFLILTMSVLLMLCFFGCQKEYETNDSSADNTAQVTTADTSLPDTAENTADTSTKAIDQMPIIEAETFDKNGHALVPDYDPFEE